MTDTDMLQQQTFYTRDHEWLTVHGDVATMGITHFAENALGDIVFVELPEAGRVVKQGDTIGVVESVKTASDVYAPASGEVIEINDALTEAPETVNESPTASGWFAKLRLANAEELQSLMDEEGYEAFLKTEAGG